MTDKRITWKASALICAVIMVGFGLTSFIGYQSSRAAFEKDAERTSLLAAEGAAREIDNQFAEPIDVSLAMAHDTLLADLLSAEPTRGDDEAYADAVCAYLESYREAFGFDSVFLVSTESNRYYHFNGVDRTLERDNPENTWYFDFLDRDEAYSLNVDNDEATADEITMFVNARILDEQGSTLAIVGVGFRMDDLKELLAGFEARTDTRVRLLTDDGTIRASTDPDENGHALFDTEETTVLSEQARSDRADVQDFWYRANGENGFLVSRYLPNLDWFLVVDHDTSQLDAQMARQFAAEALVVVGVMTLVAIATTNIFRRCNKLVSDRTLAVEQKRKSIFQEAAEQLYDNIYEVDVTHNRAANEATAQYFESAGAPPNTPFDEALAVIAERQIVPEHRAGYRETFAPAAVLAAHRAGIENLTYEFKTTLDGVSYHWIRIYAHLFVWDEDESVRMLVYRQNIDDEKRREQRLFEQMQHDSLTGLYNKAATQSCISKLLDDAPGMVFAFFILDIDDFKGVNDRLGHSAGDEVLARFSDAVRAQFRPYDIVGRIGGDEFVAFAPLPDAAAADEKATALVEALRLTVPTDAGTCVISASVGVALATEAGRDFESLYRHADEALYRAKKAGKSRFARYED
mgnify:CR=1 FL=1